MDSPAADIQDEAPVSFYCEMCQVSHTDGYDTTIALCDYCGRPLCPTFDYACTDCGRFACDSDCQACQEEDCAVIICFTCVASHLAIYHPMESAA